MIKDVQITSQMLKDVQITSKNEISVSSSKIAELRTKLNKR